MRSGRPRDRSVRSRSTTAAVAVVLLALVVAGFAVSEVVRRSVVDSARVAAESRASDVVTELVADGRVTTGLNLGGGSDGATAVVVTDAGTVVAETPADETSVAPGDDLTVTVETAVQGVTGADAVSVTQGYAAGMRTVSDVRRVLLVGVPVLAALVGWLTYVLTGRSLRPVEQIRRRSTQISDVGAQARIDVPRTGDEVERLALTLNEMLDRLQASQEAQARFVSDASHELRTPLAAMRTEIEIATTAGADADWGNAAARLMAVNVRMQRIVDDLLALARTRDGGPGRREGVDLDDVVESVGYGRRGDRAVRVEVATTPARVDGDTLELTRVVQNLVDNALLWASSTVRITLRTDAGRAVLDVDDDGPGVPVEERERVFGRFVRLDASRARDSGGSGLGLAIARAVAEAHQGRLTCSEAPLGGARFRLELPLATRDDVPAQPSGSTR